MLLGQKRAVVEGELSECFLEAEEAERPQEQAVLELARRAVGEQGQRACARKAVGWAASCRLGAAVWASCLYSRLLMTVSSRSTHHVSDSAAVVHQARAAQAVLLVV